MNPFLLAATLWRLGHALGLAPSLHDLLRALASGKLDLGRMVRSFQASHGLAETGELDGATEKLLATPRCGLPDRQESRDRPCAWPHRDVTWAQAVRLDNVPDQVVAGVFRRAWSAWSDVCGIQPVENRADSPVVTNVVSTSGKGRRDDLDGAGGVLAWSEMPCGATPSSRLRQVYDRDEPWTEHTLFLVAVHEIGHALGIPHLGPGTIMAPYLDASLKGLTPADVAEAVARYGARPTPPPPTPVQPVTIEVDVRETGKYLLTINLTPKA